MSCLHKVIVVSSSSSPKPQYNEDDLLVFITIGDGRKFAFARPGDKTWSVIQRVFAVIDFISFNSQFYGVNDYGKLKVCDFSGPRPIFVDFANAPEGVNGTERFYFVELEGELHMVIRRVDPTPIKFPPIEFHHVYMSVYFQVYKFDFCTHKWEELETLGDHAIFIGSNTTFGLNASDYPLCKPGCIYFTDDCNESYERLIGADMGIYNLEAGTIEPVYEGEDILSRFSPPVWIIPNPF
ncbi:hypothetical protein AQUCO_00700160v1 [Aquilegia coerulea]|uniref:KIB1-4 beta-propeller domain-containing protein n=1 Tax=Aquilegia coerulea TaxID=218851 RepID=A0A2G5EIX8_AQUCA|nr:hypothetical protein AQUCO_00700160v1 [Aquilegia coerulea]